MGDRVHASGSCYLTCSSNLPSLDQEKTCSRGEEEEEEGTAVWQAGAAAGMEAEPTTTPTTQSSRPSTAAEVMDMDADVADYQEQNQQQQQTSPIEGLPLDSLHQIFSHLPLPEILACRAISRSFQTALTSHSFLSHLPPLPLLALRHPRNSPPQPSALLALDPALSRWLRLPLPFLPFTHPSPVTASPSLLYLWVDAPGGPDRAKSLVACNPVAGTFRLLPQLGSAWSRHGTVLAAPSGAVLVLTEIAALLNHRANPNRWLKFPLHLPSKPRSPVLVGDSAFAICDVGSPWRSQWKLFSCRLADLGGLRGWERLERHEWGDVFDILKRPRLIRGRGEGSVLMVGGLKFSFVVDAPCSTVLILRLDLAKLEWEEAGRMPPEMYECFGGGGSGGNGGHGGNNKVKVFGGDGRVWFSGKKVRGKMAMWEEGEAGKSGGGLWSWVNGTPGYGDGMYRGFVFNATVSAEP